MDGIKKPNLLFAFANDPKPDGRHLPSLRIERNRLQNLLLAPEAKQLCDTIILPDATIDEIIGYFLRKDLRGNIAIFHYAGHADTQHLLLETINNETHKIQAKDFADFLRIQEGLNLVFLNGCYTQDHINGLLDAGIAAVIGVNGAISDETAMEFSHRFYQSLLNLHTLEEAYQEASLATKLGGNNRSIDLPEDGISELPSTHWEFKIKSGAEQIKDWSLADASISPLKNLPVPDDIALPKSPYLNLQSFTREHAHVFFGRGWVIRRLYDNLVRVDRAKITLLYGMTGIGKSSLLVAGLLPRMESQFEVHYLRRLPLKNAIEKVIEELGGGDSLESAWHHREKTVNRPVLLVLDQLDELFSTMCESQNKNEVIRAFDFFGASRLKPKGKLILSFRKEWLAEIENILAHQKLAYEKQLIERLDKRGLIEAIGGIANDLRLSEHYGLSIADNDPPLIDQLAADLLSDPDAPIAPTVQLIMSELWMQAKKIDSDHPLIDFDLYQSVRRNGLFIGDFFDRQIALLGLKNEAALKSGLIIDLLYQHTSDVGTSVQLNSDELEAIYPHIKLQLSELLPICKTNGLLVDGKQKGETSATTTRLSHDILAPIIRQRYEASNYPGQRARRILEARLKEISNQSLLTNTELDVVKLGQKGMRVWNKQEKRLLQRSSRAIQKQHRIRNLIKSGFAVASLIILISLLFGWKNYKIAQRRLEYAQKIDAHRLSLISRQLTDAGKTTQGILLALEALPNAETPRPFIKKAEVALQYASAQHISREVIPLGCGAMQGATVSPDEETIIAECRDDNSLRIYNRSTKNLTKILKGKSGINPLFHPTRYNPNTSHFMTLNWNSYYKNWVPYIWDLKNGNLVRILKDHNKEVRNALYSPDGQSILTVSDDRIVRIFNTYTGKIKWSYKLVNENLVYVTYSPDGKKIALTFKNAKTITIYILDILTKKKISIIELGNVSVSSDPQAIFCSNGRTIQIYYNILANYYVSQWNIVPSYEVSRIKIDELRFGSPQRTPCNQVGNQHRSLKSFTRESIRLLDLGFNEFFDISKIDTNHNMGNFVDIIPRPLFIETGSVNSLPPLVVELEASSLVPELTDTTVSSLIDKANERVGYSPPRVLRNSLDNKQKIILKSLFSRHVEATGLEITFSPAGQFFVSFGDKIARIWNWETGLNTRSLVGHTDTVSSAVFSEDGSKILTVSNDGSLIFWDIQPIGQVLVFNKRIPNIDDFSVSPDGKKIALETSGGTYSKVIDSDTGENLYELKFPSYPLLNRKIIIPIIDLLKKKTISGLDFTANGSQIWGLHADLIEIWDSLTGKHLRSLQFNDFQIDPDHSIELANDFFVVKVKKNNGELGSDLAIGSSKKYEVSSVLTNISHFCRIKVIVSEGQLFYCYSQKFFKSIISIFDLKNGNKLKSFELPRHFKGMAISQDNQHMYLSTSSGHVQIWDIESETFVKQFASHTAGINSIELSPDGLYLLTASEDKTARIWDIETGEPIHILRHAFPLSGAKFSPDGKFVYTHSREGEFLKKWKISILIGQPLIDYAKQILHRQEFTKAERKKFFPE